MKKNIKHFVLALLFSGAACAAEKPSVDSSNVVASIESEVKAHPSDVLTIVEKAIKLHPSYSCEIVKMAIRSIKADSKKVAAIVEVAAIASPENKSIIEKCAIAVAPDALEAVQEVLVKLDPSPAINSSSDPLDFPTNEQAVNVGPAAGQNPGAAYVPWIFPYQPPAVFANPATDNDRSN